MPIQSFLTPMSALCFVLKLALCGSQILTTRAGQKANLGGNDGYTVITFADWEKVLKASVPSDRYRAYREAIVKFRYWLRETDNVPNVDAIKQHLEWKQSYLALIVSPSVKNRCIGIKSPYEPVAGLAVSDDA